MANYSSDALHRIELIKGCGFKVCATRVEYRKTITLNKGGRSHDNPLWDADVQQEVTYSGWIPFADYAQILARRANVSVEDVDLKRVWHKRWTEDTRFCTDRRSESKLYLPIQRSDEQGKISKETYGRYFVNGHVATDAEIEIIKKWLPKPKAHKMSSTQAELNITNEEHFLPLNVMQIVSIKQGEKVVTF